MSNQNPVPAVEQRKDPRPKRAPRAQDGTVTGQRPDRRYALAYPSDVSFGLSRLLEDGYHKVNAKSDKERVTCGRTEDNGDVSYKGHILVWIDVEEFEARLADGQEIAKARMRKAKGPGGIDNVAGVNGKPANDFAENN
jgi:hypothetical protein